LKRFCGHSKNSWQAKKMPKRSEALSYKRMFNDNALQFRLKLINENIVCTQSLFYITELPQKMSKKEYFKKIRLLLKTLTIVADQIIDIILVATLFLLQEHWFVNL
jgi:hypothetical protein